MLQIALVSNKHDDDVRICMIPQLLEPSRDVRVRGVFGDIVYEQSTNCASVVTVIRRVRGPIYQRGGSSIQEMEHTQM